MVNLKELSTEKIKEMSLIDLCYAYMVEEGIERLNIYDFLDYIKPLRDASDENLILKLHISATDLSRWKIRC